MRLEDEPTCIRKLTYRVEPTDPQLGARILAAGIDAGWAHGVQLGRLHILANADGHQVLVVPTTGRVQIRLLYIVPYERRRATAERLFEQLTRWAERAPVSDGP